MHIELQNGAPEILAQSRKSGTLNDPPLDLIGSHSEARGIVDAAQDAFGFERSGYAVVGSSERARRKLGLTKPLFSEIPTSAVVAAERGFKLPAGVIGAQCEFVLTMLRPFPEPGEAITLESVADAILSCRPAIGLVGRRTRRSVAGDLAAIADFGLHVATILGRSKAEFDPRCLAEIDVTVFLFGKTVITGAASSIAGHPLSAVAWLAERLREEGRQLEPCDLVATGSATTILQVVPGQHIAADFWAAWASRMRVRIGHTTAIPMTFLFLSRPISNAVCIRYRKE